MDEHLQEEQLKIDFETLDVDKSNSISFLEVCFGGPTVLVHKIVTVNRTSVKELYLFNDAVFSLDMYDRFVIIARNFWIPCKLIASLKCRKTSSTS
jgi:hypothetical protein